MRSPKNHSSIRIARASSAEQFPKNVKIRHHTDSALFAKGLSVGRGKVPRVEGAQNIRHAIRSGVEHGIIGRIGQSYGCDYDRSSTQVSGISQIADKARRFQGGDPIPRLNPRIQQYPFDLVENEPRKNQRMRAEDEIEEA